MLKRINDYAEKAKTKLIQTNSYRFVIAETAVRKSRYSVE